MGILQARILEWAAMPSTKGSSWPRDWTQVSCIAGGFFAIWVTREAHCTSYLYYIIVICGHILLCFYIMHSHCNIKLFYDVIGITQRMGKCHDKKLAGIWKQKSLSHVWLLMTWLLPFIDYHVLSNMGFPGGSDSKESPCNAGEPEFDPWVGKIPWRRAWQPTPVFLPGESPWTEKPGGLQSMGFSRSECWRG